MAITATLKAKSLEGFIGDACLWHLSKQVIYDGGSTEYVVTSAVNVPFEGPETYIFPADEGGNILDWLELEGSFKGGLNHEAAILCAGWKITP